MIVKKRQLLKRKRIVTIRRMYEEKRESNSITVTEEKKLFQPICAEEAR